MTTLGAMHRKVIAEIAHLRLAILLENHMKIIFWKALLRDSLSRRQRAQFARETKVRRGCGTCDAYTQ